MCYSKCNKCNGTNFKIQIYQLGISIICSHCLYETVLNKYDDLIGSILKLESVEVEE